MSLLDHEGNFDLNAGMYEKALGMSRALNAERGATWAQRANAWLETVPRSVEFQSDDLIRAIGLPGPSQPNKNNVIGAWFGAKVRTGVIVPTGKRAISQRDVRHGNGNNSIWRKA